MIVDPIGVWFRASLRVADGTSKGLLVYILGGEHGDVPLDETAGEVVADFIVETRPPVVLDVSLFSKSAARRFMTDFAEGLYRVNRAPLASSSSTKRIPSFLSASIAAANGSLAPSTTSCVAAARAASASRSSANGRR